MTNLAIDIGNTLVKTALFERGQVVDIFKSDELTVDFLERTIFPHHPDIENGIMISTRGPVPEVERYLANRLKRFVRFDHTTPIPIKNLYETPETLGPDRLAAAVGAAAVDPGSNVLVVDFGTAITIDFITADGKFLGGNISPGAGARFKALHQFTGKLPLLELSEETQLLGKTSHHAIISGVINGIIYEIDGYIERLRKDFGNFKIIFTGGDGIFFAKRFKNPIFATYDLVVYGLNQILEHNV
ncbi:MAG: type III pantothenate kinase [Rikenellaceae bacterium]|jgi:type III pantothenate kinase|nr:type III pantothenate kinase [Rikenellaceae bacterium]